jgi:hypothetical protein
MELRSQKMFPATELIVPNGLLVAYSVSELDSPVIVHLQKFKGSPTFGRKASNDRAFKAKVIFPAVSPGVEQPYQLVRFWIIGADIRTLEMITTAASPTQIFQVVGTAMLPGADVFNVEG